MIRYAIQHVTSKRYLAAPPSIDGVTGEAIAASDSANYTTREHAEQEREGILDFKESYAVVEVEIEMAEDTPSNAALERIRATEHARERERRDG